MSSDDRRVMLELDNVSLSYHSKRTSFEHGIHTVLKDVSLQLYEGETLGIIGRNGVGKTTMLRLIAGILAPTSGRVWQAQGRSSALLTIGLGFRADLSGRDNALLASMLQGATRRQAMSVLDEIKVFSELGDSFEEPVKTYSSGMRSRLGFTTALLTHVDILLIDEVLSVGDAEFRAKAQRAMKERISGDQTVVFVSHNDAQIQDLCDRAIWIDGGNIKAEGNTAAVLQQYKGSINVAQATARVHEPVQQPGHVDSRLHWLAQSVELSKEQSVAVENIIEQGGGRKEIRAVLNQEQKQQLREARRKQKRERRREFRAVLNADQKQQLKEARQKREGGAARREKDETGD
jgi:homopolymeric O-antigen transport system ATP-binding protein